MRPPSYSKNQTMLVISLLVVGCADGPPPVLDSGLEPTLALDSLTQDESKALCESSVEYAVAVLSPDLIREATCREAAMLAESTAVDTTSSQACDEAFDSCLNLSSGNASQAGAAPCEVPPDWSACEVSVEEAERCLAFQIDLLVATFEAQARWRCGGAEAWLEEVDLPTTDEPPPCESMSASCPALLGLNMAP